MAIDFLRRQHARAAEARQEVEIVREEAPPIYLPGMAVDGPCGKCRVVETIFEGGHQHGFHPLSKVGGLSGQGLAALTGDPELAYADLSGAVFLDTETTGLSMGAGTYVFLVGIGYVKDEQFRVMQYFLEDPGQEHAYLAALDSHLRQFSMLVTFNGKAFDWPLLESRFVRNRQFRRAPLEDPPHVDLLHPSRRLWKRRLQSCKLSSLERTVLGVSRTEEDVPGWLIPQLYFSYLRSGDSRPLHGVFYHNLLDILSLATLAVQLHAAFSDPLGGHIEHGLDFFSAGRSFERTGESDYALACYEEALVRDLQGGDRAECLSHIARLHKRERRWDAALAIWDRLIDEGGQAAIGALIERAKYFEHVERNYVEALDDTQHALNLLELWPGVTDELEVRELEHRRGRLIERVYRQRSWAKRS